MKRGRPNEVKPWDICEKCKAARAVLFVAKKYWCRACFCPDYELTYQIQNSSSITLMENEGPGRIDAKEINEGLKKGPAGKKVHFSDWRGGW